MEFNTPLIGTRNQNYKYFYTTGFASIVSMLILLIISGYTASVATNIGGLMTTSNEVLADIQEIIPDVSDALRIIKEMCMHENFTKTYGHICN